MITNKLIILEKGICGTQKWLTKVWSGTMIIRELNLWLIMTENVHIFLE